MGLDFFESEEELMELTGLDEDGLWKSGFNLDDWDWGFRSNACYVVSEVDEYGLTDYSVIEDCPQYIWYIINSMINHFSFRAVHCGDYWYYMQYHA